MIWGGTPIFGNTQIVCNCNLTMADAVLQNPTVSKKPEESPKSSEKGMASSTREKCFLLVKREKECQIYPSYFLIKTKGDFVGYCTRAKKSTWPSIPSQASFSPFHPNCRVSCKLPEDHGALLTLECNEKSLLVHMFAGLF